MATLVVGGDGNVDVLGGRVGVGQGNDGDVDIAGLLDSLGVGARVGDDDQAGLLERAGDVVGEATGGEATGNGSSTGVSGELEDGTLTVGTGRDNANVGGVLNGDDDAGSENDLLPVKKKTVSDFLSPFVQTTRLRKTACVASSNSPGLANVDNVDTVGTSLPQVRLHVNLQVLATEVALRSQQGLDVLAGGVEEGRQVGGGHLD